MPVYDSTQRLRDMLAQLDWAAKDAGNGPAAQFIRAYRHDLDTLLYNAQTVLLSTVDILVTSNASGDAGCNTSNAAFVSAWTATAPSKAHVWIYCTDGFGRHFYQCSRCLTVRGEHGDHDDCPLA